MSMVHSDFFANFSTRGTAFSNASRSHQRSWYGRYERLSRNHPRFSFIYCFTWIISWAIVVKIWPMSRSFSFTSIRKSLSVSSMQSPRLPSEPSYDTTAILFGKTLSSSQRKRTNLSTSEVCWTRVCMIMIQKFRPILEELWNQQQATQPRS